MDVKNKMEEITKTVEKEELITDQQKKQVYEFATSISKETLDEICPALFRLALESEKGQLKNQLGQVIFHLQKIERLNTVIGLQKLLEAAIIVNKEEMFEILESSDKIAQELSKKIKAVL